MIISVKHANISNSEQTVIYDLNMEVNEGDFIYITGKVGSGKTSIFKAFTAQTPVECGQMNVCGYDLTRIKSGKIPLLRRKMGVVFQDLQLLKEKSVYDNLDFVLNATGWKKDSEKASRIKEVLSMVGMANKVHKYPYQLSGGEQQRVCIARALLNNPQVILADEPTGNLDHETAEGIMQLFSTLNKEQGTAIVMITHDRGIIARHPGKIYICANETCTPAESPCDES